jgi:hypothetical protein
VGSKEAMGIDMNFNHVWKSRKTLTLASAAALACVLLPQTASAGCFNNSNPDLVQNGGFESGSGFKIPNWIVEIGKDEDPYVHINKSNPAEGNQDLALGTIEGANEIVQHIKGTTVGQVYTVCLKLASSPNPTGGVTTFIAQWNNVNEMELTNSAEYDYQYYAFNVTASGTDYLRFLERNKQGFYYIDSVSVQLCSGCGLGPAKHKSD